MKFLTSLFVAALTFVSSASADPTPAPQAEPPYMRPISPALLTRQQVNAMAQRALDACEKLGFPATVNIVDADGSLRATFSSDNARIVGLETAPQKTAAVLEFKTSSAALQKRLTTDPAFAAQYGKDKRFLFYPGGLPLFRDGKLVGAIAVGGARTNDEVCAREGLKAAIFDENKP